MSGDKRTYTAAEIKAGLMVIASLAVFVLFLAIVREMRPPEKTAQFHAYFTDTGGLNKGADVRYGGAKVGRVTTVGIDPRDKSRICVEFMVRADTPINDDSVAYVGQTSLTAEKHLEVTTGSKEAKPKPPDSDIKTETRDLFGLAGEVGGKVGVVLDRVKEILGIKEEAEGSAEAGDEGKKDLVSVPKLLENVDGAVSDVRTVLSDNRQNIDSFLGDLQKIQDSAQQLMDQMNTVISENRADVQGTLDGAHRTVDRIDASLTKVDEIIGRVSGASGRLDGLADTLQAALDHAKALSGDARRVFEENRPQIEDMIRDLREAVSHFKEFAREIKEQPQSVIRGQQPQGRKSE